MTAPIGIRAARFIALRSCNSPVTPASILQAMNTNSPDLDSLAASETHVVSFVVRFVFEEASPHGRWRGLIRHVQSDAEQPFVRWDDAAAFVSQYVPLAGPAAGV